MDGGAFPDTPSTAGRGEPVRRSAAIAAIITCALLSPTAGDAATVSRSAPADLSGRLSASDNHRAIARLEAQAARLSKQYRGQLETLAGAEADAKSAASRARLVRHQLDRSRHQIARLAAASYVNGGTDQTLMALFSGQTGRILGRSAMITY